MGETEGGMHNPEKGKANIEEDYPKCINPLKKITRSMIGALDVVYKDVDTINAMLSQEGHIRACTKCRLIKG